MPLKAGTSHEVVSENMREMMKAGHSMKQSLAASLNMKRKSQKMYEGGEAHADEAQDKALFEDMMEGDQEGPISMEPPMERNVESGGTEESFARDLVDQGASPKPEIPPMVDKGSPDWKGDGMKNDSNNILSDEMREIIKRRKMSRSYDT